MRIGIVANEVSGDLLGGALIKALHKIDPTIKFEGVAGKCMLAAGCETLYPIETFSVMGFVEPLKHLPELIGIRRQLVKHFTDNPPDLFIGIDAPDFNLGLEMKLHKVGIKTLHFVSPTVWAWRSGRTKTIRKSVDLLLTLFPFETNFLLERGVNAQYVGHPLAEEIPFESDRVAARQRLNLPLACPIIALLPGSRMSEVNALSIDFLQAAKNCLQQKPDLQYVVPLVNQTIRIAFESKLQQSGIELPITLIDGHARDVIQSANVVLTASGTATMETLLLKRPMVVAYRVHWFSYFLGITMGLVKTKYIAMANLLADEELAPEFLQKYDPEMLSTALLSFLNEPEKVQAIEQRYLEIHRELKQDTGRQAAEAVLALIGRRDHE
ncbi:MAG: lipid-A-disaccharide synthase [Candidatus Polarisedimenticolaceae bacterium]|nr:lipid-A-disaccharide synthase [Candidatus Polarisedimenticolaceae bacterium]